MRQFENTIEELQSRQNQSTFDRYVSRQGWIRLQRVSELVDRVRSHQPIVCFCTGTSYVFLQNANNFWNLIVEGYVSEEMTEHMQVFCLQAC